MTSSITLLKWLKSQYFPHTTGYSVCSMFLPVGVHGCTEPYPSKNTCTHSLCTQPGSTLSWLPCLEPLPFYPHHKSYAFCNPSNSLFTVRGNSSLFHPVSKLFSVNEAAHHCKLCTKIALSPHDILLFPKRRPDKYLPGMTKMHL